MTRNKQESGRKKQAGPFWQDHLSWPLESQTETSPHFSFFHSSFVTFFVCSTARLNFSTFLQTSELKGLSIDLELKEVCLHTFVAIISLLLTNILLLLFHEATY